MSTKLYWGRVQEISTVDAGANLKLRCSITKRKGPATMADFKEAIEAALETPVEGEDEVTKGIEDTEVKEKTLALYRVADALGLQKVFEQPTEAEEVEKDLENDDDQEDDDMSDELEKVSENLAKRFEALQKQLDTEKAAREAVEEKLQKAKDEAELNQWVAKAEANLKFVPGDLKEVAENLFETSKISPELAQKHFERLCETSKLLEKSDTFKVQGSSGRQAATGLDAVVKKADEYKDKGLDPMDAFMKAAIENEKKQ